MGFARQRTPTAGNPRAGALARRLVPAGFAILAAFLFSGCAPKRVSPVSVARHPSPTRVKKTLSPAPPPVPVEIYPQPNEGIDPDQDLPAPESRPRSGRPGYRTTPGSLELGLQAAELARDQMGKQYQWGASGPDRFDCSGLTHYVFSQVGVDLPRVSRDQARAGQEIGRSELQPGDLVFFGITGSKIDHVGIYLGNGKFVHAPRRHMPVRADSLNDSWWRRRFRVARRVS